MRTLLLATVTFASINIGASADELVQNFTAPLSTPNWYVPQAFTAIDPTLYTINSVDLSLSTDIYGNIQVQNLDSSNSGPVSVSSNGTFGIYYADFTEATSMNVAAPTDNETLTPYAGQYYFTDSSGVNDTSLYGTATQDTLLTDPTSLSYFYTTGAQSLYLVGMDFSYVTTDLPNEDNISTLMDGALTLTINYSPIGSSNDVTDATSVPEPGALGVFGVALVGLYGGVQRRRGSRS